MKHTPLRSTRGWIAPTVRYLLVACASCTTRENGSNPAPDRPAPANAATRSSALSDFEGDALGSMPGSFAGARTGDGAPGEWKVLESLDAPSGKRVLAQLSTDATEYRFPLCVREDVTARDVVVSVKFKAVSGDVDRAAGLVARYQGPGDYYVTRANALEGNVRLYRMRDGRREQIAGVEKKIESGRWYELSLSVRERRLAVSLDGAVLLEASDDTIGSAGRAGVWTKADSVTEFDDLRVVVVH